jgi:hypothetical protein
MNLIVEWNHLALEAIRALGKLPSTDPDRGRGGPPQVARTLSIFHTATFNAWTAYNAVAKPVYGAVSKRPAAEHGLQVLKSVAIAEAAYRVLKDQFPFTDYQRGKVPEVQDFLDELEASYAKYVTSVVATPPVTAAALAAAKTKGAAAATVVLNYRQSDNANEANRYADPTNYQPKNKPMAVALPAAADAVDDPNAWQGLSYLDGEHILRSPAFITPHWGYINAGDWSGIGDWPGVKPFAMSNGKQFRPAVGPHKVLTQAYLDQAKHVIDIQANLTTEQKVIAEYWADGPNSSLPPGHWTEFASFVAEREALPGLADSGKLNLDQSVKLFFALSNAVFDASIAVWDCKRYYDSVRPVTAIRYLFAGKTIRAWGGPGRGTQDIPGESWQPFQKASFPTPPFAEYVSGHSGFSMAAATVLRLFTGSDRFGFLYTQDKPLAADPNEPVVGVTLSWPTFNAAAREAGESRLYGGIHFYEGNVVGLDMGAKVGQQAYEKAEKYWLGTA